MVHLRNSWCVVVLLHGALGVAQSPRAPEEHPAPLKLSVLRGDGVQNSIKTRAAVDVQVEVRDVQGQRLPGIPVFFELPTWGPGASFAGGRLAERTTTNAEGIASTTGLVPNSEAGRFSIKVTATSGGATALATVFQTNVAQVSPERKHSNRLLWVLIAGGAAAAAGGVVLATHGQGNSVSSIPTGVLVTGPISVGAPH